MMQQAHHTHGLPVTWSSVLLTSSCLSAPGSKVALQYAGDAVPIVFEISLGAIDRGASLKFLSQYPREEEILLPPRSYLEVVGGLSRQEADENGRLIRIISLKVNANVSSSTIEGIEVGFPTGSDIAVCLWKIRGEGAVFSHVAAGPSPKY
jgi:hypothetical protein